MSTPEALRLKACMAGEHTVVEISRATVDGGFADSVVEWCEICGMIRTYNEYDNRKARDWYRMPSFIKENY